MVLPPHHRALYPEDFYKGAWPLKRGRTGLNCATLLSTRILDSGIDGISCAVGTLPENLHVVVQVLHSLACTKLGDRRMFEQ